MCPRRSSPIPITDSAPAMINEDLNLFGVEEATPPIGSPMTEAELEAFNAEYPVVISSDEEDITGTAVETASEPNETSPQSPDYFMYPTIVLPPRPNWRVRCGQPTSNLTGPDRCRCDHCQVQRVRLYEEQFDNLKAQLDAESQSILLDMFGDLKKTREQLEETDFLALHFKTEHYKLLIGDTSL